MRDHFFISDTDGALYDCRTECWHKRPPLRPNYRRHHTDIRTVADLKATLRAGRTTDLGGYPLYFIAADGEPLSFDAVLGNLREAFTGTAADGAVRDGWRIVACAINYEDSTLACAHTGEPIPCAYSED